MSGQRWSAGILRGHTGKCPHRMWKVCAHTPLPLTQASNPDFPHLTQAVTMAVSIPQLHIMVIDAYHLLPRPVVHNSSPRMCNYFQRGSFVETVFWMWHRCRSGIAVCIRNGKLALFVPFCNPLYENTWSDRARRSVPPGDMPAARWWANGWTLCGDKISDQLWSDTGVCAILHMLMTACQEKTMSDCSFIINKRDSAVVRRDGCDALNPLDAYQVPMRRPNLVPILSLYTGDQFADIAMPLPVDWHRLTQGAFNGQCPQPCVSVPRDVPWSKKQNCAVFRGSMTGAGGRVHTNQRMALLQLHDGHNFDMRGTGRNARWRYCPLEKKIVMPQTMQHVGQRYRIPLHKQQEKYKYTVTIDGHSGADRLAALMGGRQCILKVDSPCHALCPDTWASERMFAWEHYVPIKRNLSNLKANLNWAREAHAARARMLQQCDTWASKERATILSWWEAVTADMASLR